MSDSFKRLIDDAKKDLSSGNVTIILSAAKSMFDGTHQNYITTQGFSQRILKILHTFKEVFKINSDEIDMISQLEKDNQVAKKLLEVLDIKKSQLDKLLKEGITEIDELEKLIRNIQSVCDSTIHETENLNELNELSADIAGTMHKKYSPLSI